MNQDLGFRSCLFSQEYSEKEQANADPSDPPLRSIKTYLQQPLDRIQKYKAVLKVTALTETMQTMESRAIYIYIYITYENADSKLEDTCFFAILKFLFQQL